MSHTFKGILSFPVLTQNALNNKRVRDPDAKYGLMLMFAPGDAQITTLSNLVNTIAQDKFPNGFPSSGSKCFGKYSDKIPADKTYYDARFAEYYVLTTSVCNMDDFSPSKNIIDQNRQPVLDPSDIFAGAVVYVNVGIGGFIKGKGGVGAWLNAVMLTNEEPPLGRLDSKPTVDQMFADVPVTSAAPPAAPAPAAPPAAPAPVVEFIMTEKAQGATKEQFIAQGWTEDALLEHGYMMKPSFV